MRSIDIDPFDYPERGAIEAVRAPVIFALKDRTSPLLLLSMAGILCAL